MSWVMSPCTCRTEPGSRGDFSGSDLWRWPRIDRPGCLIDRRRRAREDFSPQTESINQALTNHARDFTKAPGYSATSATRLLRHDRPPFEIPPHWSDNLVCNPTAAPGDSTDCGNNRADDGCRVRDVGVRPREIRFGSPGIHHADVVGLDIGDSPGTGEATERTNVAESE